MPQFVFVFIFILLVLLSTSSSASPKREVYALWKLKASVVPSNGSAALADWDPAAASPVHCSFSGVTCDTGARVVAINITALPLHGGTLLLEVYNDLTEREEKQAMPGSSALPSQRSPRAARLTTSTIYFVPSHDQVKAA
ncbi:leucine-rich repeat receptor-like kinase protein FLORAL ORGAN NUMBER1 [Hordeum vulgare]|nr:leucine-rich repeat receptor-like kinase protein FLORAL ORGAN NUMBER1 [Hordeum vulgare]